jgi:hypothetical protein
MSLSERVIRSRRDEKTTFTVLYDIYKSNGYLHAGPKCLDLKIIDCNN